MKGKLLEKPLFYIYKILFSDGSTYVGSHIQWKTDDGYICSSKYYERHPELTIVSREILFYLPSLEQMNVMETICIMDDKCYSKRNVNGNYGNYIYNFHSKLDCPWNKGLKMSKEICQKMSDAMKEPIICIETMELIESAAKIKHASEVSTNGRNTTLGKHYRKISKKEKEQILSGSLEETKALNKAYLLELYSETTFFYCVEYNTAWEAIDSIAGMLGTNSKTIKDNFGKNYRGYTIIPVDGNFVFGNDIILFRKLNLPNWSTKKVKCVETNIIYNSIKEASEQLGINHISGCINGHRKTAGGFHWEVVNEQQV